MYLFFNQIVFSKIFVLFYFLCRLSFILFIYFLNYFTKLQILFDLIVFFK